MLECKLLDKYRLDFKYRPIVVFEQSDNIPCVHQFKDFSRSISLWDVSAGFIRNPVKAWKKPQVLW